MGRFRAHAGHRVVDPATLAGDFRAWNVHDTFLRVIHHGHPRRNTLADHRTSGERAVGVEGLDPVVIFNAQIFGIVLTQPDDWPAA
ncbi:hypothetical protein D3C76_1724230 [compost metagenome]